MAMGRMLLLAAWMGVASSAAAQTERFSVIANGEKVGHLVATINGAETTTDYAVNNNGRGPKLKERVVVDARGIPTQWEINGSSLFGGEVKESTSFANGSQGWVSQADKGAVKVKSAKLYVANDNTPWAYAIYTKALLAAPNNTLDVLPAGQLRLEKLRDVTLGEGADAITLTAYALSGIDMTPEFVLLDREGKLFAQLSGVMREGYEKHADALKKLSQDLTLEKVQAAQKKIAHRYNEPVRIQNVRVFQPETLTLSEPVSVTVFDGRITTVEPVKGAGAQSDDITVIDGQGGTLVAGLHDMHSHNSLGTGMFYLAAGVTSVRDMGNDNSALQDLMTRLGAGDVPGPHIIPSGFIEGRSPFSARNGFIPETLEDGLKAVRWYADRGYIQIKIYNSMNRDWVKPLAAEAKRLGLRTVGHVPAFSTPDRVIADGYNEISHINQLVLGWLLDPGEDTRTALRLTAMARTAKLDLNSERVRKTIALMKQNDVGLDTTTVILERLMTSRAGEVAAGDKAYLDHVPIAYQRYRKRTFVTIANKDEDAAYQKSFDKLLEIMALLHKEGIKMWPGTDDGTGFTVHRELELYQKAGIPAAEVLRMATYDIDKYMGREQQFGSIARGKRADFFLIPGDPTKDIAAVRQIRMVMKDGVIYYPQEIYQELNIKPFASPPPITVATAKPKTSKAADAGLMRSAFGEPAAPHDH